MGQGKLAFFALLRKNVAFERVLALDFTCAGQLESLFGTGFGFHFWHFSLYLIIPLFLICDLAIGDFTSHLIPHTLYL
jgi:hypothetical protein